MALHLHDISFPAGRLSALASAVMLLLGAADSHAKPAYRGEIKHVQPDGSQISIYRSGDENYNEIRDAQGRLLVATPDGWMIPADSNRAMTLKAPASEPRPKKYLFSGTPFPCEGSPRALVILVDFPDKLFSMDDPNGFYTRLLNQEGFSDYEATGSVRDFFVENSNGAFAPQFDVYGPVTTSHNMAYYGGNTYYGEDQHPEEVVIEALKNLDDKVDFSIYDIDGDGQIDNVYIFYAGYGEADTGFPNTIWPHSADIKDFNLGIDYYFDGKLVNRYGISNEIDYLAGRPDGIGTFVHEFSHVMGLPDLYSTIYNGAFSPGTFDALDYGPYNNAGRTPPHYSVFERYSLGWITPRTIDADGVYMLDPLHKCNTGFIIPTDRSNEFFMLENRQQECCDEFIPGHGMLIWHIDFQQDVWDDNVVNNNVGHQYVDLIEADNRLTDFTRAGDPFPGTKNVTEFNSHTLPAFVTWSGKEGGVSLSDITEDSSGRIRFYAKVTGSGVEEVIADAARLPVEWQGGMVTNVSESDVRLYDPEGRLVALLRQGESRSGLSGIYIAVAGTQRHKIKL